MNHDTLSVWYAERRVGTLWRGEDGRLMGFEYEEDWQRHGHAISNSLPFSQRTWPPETLTAHHWFGNLLPEEQARTALIRQLGIPDDDFSLLAAIGGDCAGALTILPPGHAPDSATLSSEDVVPFSQDKLHQWAAFKQRYTLFKETSTTAKPRLSLAGAQDKIPVVWLDEAFYLPRGTTASSHIIKFAVEGREQVIFNELYLNTLAALVGLDCPKTYVRYVDRYPLLIIERYDRQKEGDVFKRIHQEDLCQAMGISRTRKYQEHGGPTFADCIQALREICKPPARSLQQLLRWQIFNVLVGNSDGHAKNVSLLQNEKGKWRIAPAYDLVGTIVLGYDPRLAFSIGEQYNAMQLLTRDWQAFADACQLSYPFIKREIEHMRMRLSEHVDSTDIQHAVAEAGLPKNAWPRLQQQRHHIVKQCKKSAQW
ncbi:type II toxin-antitoxin system HipA family toxin [Vreelandella massiliensis]|uniref:type II toxin-antitoxin system HipA family toxin n=1 Tax=Vreelandella massiliensis TaxID=1816686 RepID=UPI00096A2E40|nr:type II toxin-antitoxin system HipA family toxin [Halomonas massiliensis]